MTHSVCVKGELKGHISGSIPSYPLSNHLFRNFLNWRPNLGCCIIYQWKNCSPEKYLHFNPLLPLFSKVTCGYESYNIHFKHLFYKSRSMGEKITFLWWFPVLIKNQVFAPPVVLLIPQSARAQINSSYGLVSKKMINTQFQDPGFSNFLHPIKSRSSNKTELQMQTCELSETMLLGFEQISKPTSGFQCCFSPILFLPASVTFALERSIITNIIVGREWFINLYTFIFFSNKEKKQKAVTC